MLTAGCPLSLTAYTAISNSSSCLNWAALALKGRREGSCRLWPADQSHAGHGASRALTCSPHPVRPMRAACAQVIATAGSEEAGAECKLHAITLGLPMFVTIPEPNQHASREMQSS